MQTRLKVAIGLVGLGALCAVVFQNCAEPFAPQIAPSGYQGYGSNGTGAAGSGGSTGSGGTGSPAATPTPAPNQYLFTVNDKLYGQMVSAQFDPASASTIYAVDSKGMVSKSIDSGATWKSQCRIGYTYQTKFIFSGANVFLQAYNSLYKIADFQGGGCGTSKSANYPLTVVVTPSGRLYAFEGNTNFTIPTVSTSADGGKTWVAVNLGLAANVTDYAWSAGPNYVAAADDALLVLVNSSGTSPVFKVSATGATAMGTPTISEYYSTRAIARDPAGTLVIATSSSTYSSTDNGATFKRDTATLIDKMDSSGAVYNTSTANGVVTVMRAPALGQPFAAYVVLKSATDVYAVSGAAQAIVNAMKLWVSTDSGGYVDACRSLVTADSLVIRSVASVGSRVYLASTEFILRSNDSGKTFSLVQEIGALNISPLIAVNPADPDSAFLAADTNSSGSVFKTTDGFTTLVTPAGVNFTNFPYAFSLAVSTTPASLILGSAISMKYFDSESSYSLKNLALTDTSGYAEAGYTRLTAVLPGRDSEALSTSAGKLFKYSFADAQYTNLMSSFPLADAAAITQRATSSTAVKIWVLSKTGKIAESVDGVTFTQKASGTFTVSTGNLFLASADDAGSAFAAYERNTSNLQVGTLTAWSARSFPGCTIQSVASVGANWIVACSQVPPRFIAR